jgi:integrase
MEKVSDVKVNYTGLLIEPLKSGATRYRVRVEGQKARRITVPVGPDHPDFGHHYWAARAGEKWARPDTAPPLPVKHSIAWLMTGYLDHLTKRVAAGLNSPATLRQRRSLLTRFCHIPDDDGDPIGNSAIDAPPWAFVKARDAWAATPAEADNMIKAVRAAYAWAVERGDIEANPVRVATIHRSRGGATPWTAADLARFREVHPPGTMPHLWLTLQAFTGCRVGDALWLGRECEVTIDGVPHLHWQPRKKGSAPVTIPLLPPLWRATRAQKVIGAAYVLSDHGRPFKSPDSLRNAVRRWCDDAGLTERSSHGIRKALAEMLAELGCTEMQIMAVLAHTQPKTSAIYTKGANRTKLAGEAMTILEAINW